MKLKRNIAACIGCMMVLILGISMIFGGCGSSEVAKWDYSSTPSTTGGQSQDGTTEGTAAPTGGNTGDPTGTTGSTGPEVEPSVDIELGDREDFDTTEPTTGSTDGNTGSTGGNTGSTDGNTGSTDGNTGSTGGNTGSTGGNTGSTGGNTGSTGGNTGSTGGNTAPTEPSYDGEGYMTYEAYIALSGKEQMDYFSTFPSLTAFNEWYNAAKAAYEAEHPKETIGPDGNITLD